MTVAADQVAADKLIGQLKRIPGAETVTSHNRSLWVEGLQLDVEAAADVMAALGIRFGTITAIPLGPDGETTIIYHFTDERQIINIKTRTRNGTLASLANKLPAASWPEREIKDLFAVEFLGHPNLIPLMKPQGFEPGMLRAAMCGPRVLPKSPTSRLTTT
jgi:NADH:ubiquinone oxidoreductase subunit C